MNLRLEKLTLTNFKGIKDLSIDFAGRDADIFGANATGKTTIYDAFLWLLFDKDSQNRADFAIKTLDKNGEPIHHLDHEVEGVFEVDGETIELKKVYREKWVKKRGSATEEFSGHEVDHFIDGVPVKKGEYTERVEQIAPEDRFKLLTSPLFFNDHMKWQDRRELLIEIAGDVTMEDVIAANPDLKELPKVLGKRDPDQHKAVIMAKRTEINKELERIPIRIDEVHNGLPYISAIENPDADAVEGDLEKLAKAKAGKEAELASLLNGGNTGEIRKKIAELEAQMLTIATEYKREFAKKVGEIEANIRGCQDSIRDVQRKISIKKVDLEHNREFVKATEKRMAELRNKWHEVNSRELELCIDESCPTCGQDLPADKVQEAKDKYIAEFNTTKAEKLEEINAEGKAKKEELEKVKATIVDLEKEMADLEATLATLAEDNAGLNEDLAKQNATFEDYKDLPEYKKLVAEVDKLQKQLDGEQVDFGPEKERIEAEIKTISEATDAILKAKATRELYQQGEKRIAELKEQETKLAKEFEALEEQLHLIEEFVRAKVSLLTDKINSKFDLAEFKLFEVQINGGINPVCETTYNGVPWGSLNSAGKVQVGLDIIRTLQDHYGLRCPVWIDNRESVVALPEMDCQVISLIVSEKDKTLRIEGQDATSEGQALLFEEAI